MGLCMKWEINMAEPSGDARNHSYKKPDNWEDGDGRMASSQQTIILGLLHLVEIQMAGSPDNIRIWIVKTTESVLGWR